MNTYIDPYVESVDPSVACSDCEAVCCRLTVVLTPSDHVPDWLIERHTSGMQTLLKDADGWCAAVDRSTSRCTIYEQRPAVCQKFTTGSPGCRYERANWFGRTSFPTPVVLIG